jgi:hypothetical protein
MENGGIIVAVGTYVYFQLPDLDMDVVAVASRLGLEASMAWSDWMWYTPGDEIDELGTRKNQASDGYRSHSNHTTSSAL